MKNIVIGAGPAGRLGALELGKLKEETILIEKNHIAGTCLNEGCMVICALNDISKFLNNKKRYEKFGFIKGDLDFSYSEMVKNIVKTQELFRKLNQEENESVNNQIIYGEAKVNLNDIEVNGETYEYDNLLIATGARPHIPNIKGSKYALTNKDILKLKDIPKTLNIVGGGIIACEVANIFSSFGSNVNVIVRSSFLKEIDEDMKSYILKKLIPSVNILEKCDVLEIKKDQIITSKGTFEGETLIATGRTPNSEIVKDLVNTNSKGEIEVNSLMETSKKNIYAAGDVIGGYNLTPVARMEGIIAARNMAGFPSKVNYKNIPQSLSLDMDLSFTKPHNSKNSELYEIKFPGLGGPNSFWRALDGNTGLTKISINKETKEVEKVSSLSPSSVDDVAYFNFLMNIGFDMDNYDDFIEIHPSTDAIYKIMKSFY